MVNRTPLAVATVLAVGASLLFAGGPSAVAAEAPLLPVVRPASPTAVAPTSYPVQPQLRVFADDPTDASIDRGTIPYDDIAPALNDLMRRSDRVSTQVIGSSELGRDIYLVTVTSPETTEQTAQQAAWRDAIKFDPAAASADPRILTDYKVPMWFNSNIQGNEWEGTDASLDYIARLADDTTTETAELLETTRLYFTVTSNPDARVLGQRPNINGYDPNRDMITGATQTGSVLRDITGVIQPTYFVDLHGYTGILQVEPCGPPHGENYEYDLFLPHAYAAALDVERRVAEANIPGNTYDDGTGEATTDNTGKILIPYRDIREGWDDWPPIFAPQYVAYQGAITNTVELPLGRVRPADDPVNKANSAVDVEVAGVVIDTIIDYVDENRAALLSNQIEIFERGLNGAAQEPIPADIAPEDLAPGVPTEWTEIWDETDIYTAEFPRAYVIPVAGTQRSRSDAENLVQQLLLNDIRVERTTASFESDGVTYPAGSFLVDMHQPLRGLANVLLADGSDISERVSQMYDVSAWSLSLLWGADVASVGITEDPALEVTAEQVESVDPGGSVPAAGTYLTLEPRGVAEYQAVVAMLNDGVPLSQLPDGRIVLGPDAASYESASEVAELFGIDFAPSDGTELLAGGSVALANDLRVGYTTSDDRDVLIKLGFRDLVEVTRDAILEGSVDLSSVDLLLVGSDDLEFDPATDAAGIAAVQSFLTSGRPVVGIGPDGADFAASFGLLDAGATSGTGGSNGILSLTTPGDSVLGDYPQDTAFAYPAVWFRAPGAGVTVERSYAADPFVSGHWPDSDGASQADAAGQPAAVSTVTATGNRVFLFGTSPTFRDHTVGAFSDLARAMYWAAPQGRAVAPPVVALPSSTSLDLYHVALQRQRLVATADVDVPGGPTAGTVEFRVDGRIVGTAQTGYDGLARIALPRLSRGVHYVTATFIGTESAAASKSTRQKVFVL